MEITGVIGGIIIGIIMGGAACWTIRHAQAGSQLARQRETHNAAENAMQQEIASLQGQLQQTATTQQMLETAKTQFSETAKITASETMQSNNRQFIELAQENIGKTLETVKGELNERHRQFQELVKPLSENYGRLNPQIESLMQQNRSLTADTVKLSSALTDNRRAGRWGEMQLRRVVELAEMTDYCDFAEQEPVQGSQRRPDLTVKLPEGRSIIVDAKASTLAYMEAQQAEDEESANSSLSRHAQAMKGQVDELVRRKYGADNEKYLDFVIMFVPGDQFLAAALSSNPQLVEYAMAKRVAIATPSSLISMLWAVSNGWRQHRLAADAAEIKKAGEDMHQRMMNFINHHQEVGKELTRAVNAYNKSVGSFDARLAPQGRRFAQLVTGNEDNFKQPEMLEVSPRNSVHALAPAPDPLTQEIRDK